MNGQNPTKLDDLPSENAENTAELPENPRKRGRPVGTGGNKRPDKTVHTNPGDNTRYILHSFHLADLIPVDRRDPVQMAERVREYFEICAEDDMKPSVAGLALATGIDRRRLWEIREGKKGQNPEVADVLKKAMQMLDLQMNDYMQNGKINPVAGIFLMKNNFGYKNEQEVVVSAKSPLGDTKDTKELQARYMDSVVPVELPSRGQEPLRELPAPAEAVPVDLPPDE